LKTIVTKAAYAALRNRSPSAVSNWISKGRISPAALIGVGTRAKIWVERADADLAARLDPGQQDAQVRPIALQALPSLDKASPAAEPSQLSDDLRRARLQQIELQTQKLREEAAARTGIYCRTDDARRNMGRIAGQVLSTCEGALGELATAIAATFSIPQRDVLHIMRSEFRAVRERASVAQRTAAAELPALVEDEQLTEIEPRPAEENAA
jgi:hypothetical protein